MNKKFHTTSHTSCFFIYQGEKYKTSQTTISSRSPTVMGQKKSSRYLIGFSLAKSISLHIDADTRVFEAVGVQREDRVT